MRGKCECGYPFSIPGPRFHGADRADVYIIIRVRACCCGECALNPPTSQPIPRRRPSPAPAQRHARPQAARYTPRRLHNSFPTEDLRPPRTATRPPRALPLPHAAPMHARRLRDAFPAVLTTHSRRRPSPAPLSDTPAPSVPLRAQKNGTAQRVCDAECLGRPSCGQSLGLVSRALFAAVAGRWRVGVGLRPQPWALRSRRCGRVLRA